MTPHDIAHTIAIETTAPGRLGLRWRRAPGGQYVVAPPVVVAPRVVVVRLPLDPADVSAALRPEYAGRLAATLGVQAVRVVRDGPHVRVDVPRPGPVRAIRLPHGAAAPPDAVALSTDGRWLGLGLDDASPHALVVGTTGSGKTTAQVAVALVESRRSRVIVANPKRDPAYAPLACLGHTVASEPPDIAAALAWAAALVGTPGAGRVVVVIDEWAMLDQDATAACQTIAQRGRSAGLRLVIGTQYPRADVVSTITRVNVDRVLAGALEPAAARAILGDAAATYGLTGRGDMVLGSRLAAGDLVRVQVACVTDADWATAGAVAPLDIPAATAEVEASRPVRAPHPSQTPLESDPDAIAWIVGRVRTNGGWPGVNTVQRRFGVGPRRAVRMIRDAKAAYHAGDSRADADAAPAEIGRNPGAPAPWNG